VSNLETPTARSLGRVPTIAIAVCVAAIAAAVASHVFADTAEAGGGTIYETVSTATSTQAGAHPDVLTVFKVGTQSTEGEIPCGCNSLKDMFVNTPAGLVANPTDLPQCTAIELGAAECPVDSQLGVQVITIGTDIGGVTWVPLYNMVPAQDQLALWASPAPIVEVPIYTVISSRTESDYGIEFNTVGVPNLLAPRKVAQINWGVPGASVHDTVRFGFTSKKARDGGCEDNNPVPELLANEFPCSSNPPAPTPANNAPVPYLSNPTACVGPTITSFDAVGYDLTTSHAEASFPAMIGCDQLTFDPSLSAKPTTTEADSPSGIDVNVTVPQTLSPTTPTPSALEAATVILPEGLTINANAADGKTSCTDTQARFGTRLPAQCPDSSKIGTLQIESASFPAPLPGAMYLGEPLPGNRYRIFWVFDGFSIHAKIAGVVTPDPQTGRLTATFEDLPQFSFQRFNLHFFGAERGLLATPTHCGTYAVDSRFTPWASPHLPEQTSTQFFVIDSGPGGSPCPPSARPFSPAVQAGVVDNTAGAHTDFVFDLRRRDGDQNLTSAVVSTPPGFAATLAGIPDCPDSALTALAQSSYLGAGERANPICAASQVGTNIASAGAGSKPVFLSGRVYLAGPYKGAPLSLALVTPAVSGPYDLGNVVVRVAVQVDRSTARVTAVSDPLPQIIEGIPLRVRSVRVSLDRDRFAFNPTNCDPFSVGANISGDQGASVSLTSHFQVANCGALPYEPKLSLRLTGGLNRLGHPAIHARFAAAPGEANTRRVSVTLPRGQLLDNAHIQTICTRTNFAAGTCPAGSRIGSAVARTPILDEPLRGPVYLRSSSNKLPDLVVELEGRFDFELVARIDSVNGRLRSTFDSVPDVPVSSFELDLLGGRKGLLINSDPLCGSKRRATARMTGQNGMRISRRPKLQIACEGKKQRKHHGREARGTHG
jgi:hypothetical protein